MRLSSLAARHIPIELAAAKCTVLAALALGAPRPLVVSDFMPKSCSNVSYQQSGCAALTKTCNGQSEHCYHSTPRSQPCTFPADKWNNCLSILAVASVCQCLVCTFCANTAPVIVWMRARSVDGRRRGLQARHGPVVGLGRHRRAAGVERDALDVAVWRGGRLPTDARETSLSRIANDAAC